MATMIPQQPPPNEQGKKAERTLYLALDDQLPADFHVYHGLQLLTDEAARTEIDFLVAHRELGLLCVECKGGGVKRDVSGNWVRWHGGEREEMTRGPWEQSERQMDLLGGELYRRCRHPAGALGAEAAAFDGVPLTYGHAVAFPFANREARQFPLEADERILIDEGDFDDLTGKVRSAMAFWQTRHARPPLSERDFELFRDRVLFPAVGITSTLAARLRQEDRAFARLSEEQTKVLANLLNHDRIGVEGGAGTGKTLLALETARRWADRGERVLLTCFNRKLAEYLDERVDSQRHDRPGAIRVAHFHKLCFEAAEALDRELDFPERGSPEASEFWELDFPLVLMEALEAGVLESGEFGDGTDEPAGWDAVVADEAQDFADPWWEILEAGFPDENDDRPNPGRMALFYDPAQSLFERGRDLPELDRHQTLTYNFRNTTEIAEVVDRLYTGEATIFSHQSTPDGEPPVVQNATSEEGQRNAVDRLVRRLVHEERLGPENLAILTPRTPKHSSLAGLETIGGLPVTDDLDAADDQLLHTSISAFKGLERDVVILADADPHHERCSRKARYVAASRAVNRLYVFQKNDWLADVE